MKVILREGKTIAINPFLFKEVMEEISYVFLTYQGMIAGKPSNNSTLIKQFDSFGGLGYFNWLYKNNYHHQIWENRPLKEVFRYGQDPILTKRLKMSPEEFWDLAASKGGDKISLTFWINNENLSDSKNMRGFFNPHTEGLDNLIAIKFPHDKAALMPGWLKQIESTVRHELQHFTQSYYSKILGLNHWIGLPPKSTISVKKRLRGKTRTIRKNSTNSDSGKHQDIPVETSTDVQDEIDEFLPDLKLASASDIRERIINFVGIGDRSEANPIFRHYFETNKDIWKWAVSKLLSSVNRM